MPIGRGCWGVQVSERVGRISTVGELKGLEDYWTLSQPEGEGIPGRRHSTSKASEAAESRDE